VGGHRSGGRPGGMVAEVAGGRRSRSWPRERVARRRTARREVRTEHRAAGRRGTGRWTRKRVARRRVAGRRARRANRAQSGRSLQERQVPRERVAGRRAAGREGRTEHRAAGAKRRRARSGRWSSEAQTGHRTAVNPYPGQRWHKRRSRDMSNGTRAPLMSSSVPRAPQVPTALPREGRSCHRGACAQSFSRRCASGQQSGTGPAEAGQKPRSGQHPKRDRNPGRRTPPERRRTSPAGHHRPDHGHHGRGRPTPPDQPPCQLLATPHPRPTPGNRTRAQKEQITSPEESRPPASAEPRACG
jgi:hypothetical protein